MFRGFVNKLNPWKNTTPASTSSTASSSVSSSTTSFISSSITSVTTSSSSTSLNTLTTKDDSLNVEDFEDYEFIDDKKTEEPKVIITAPVENIQIIDNYQNTNDFHHSVLAQSWFPHQLAKLPAKVRFVKNLDEYEAKKNSCKQDTAHPVFRIKQNGLYYFFKVVHNPYMVY